MNLKPLWLSLSVLISASVCAQAPVLDTDMKKVSYSIGVDLGRSIKKQNLDLDMSVLVKGLQEGYAGGATLLSDDQMKEVLTNFQKQFIAKKNAEMEAMAKKNLDTGKAFLENNKKQSGIVTLADGLQYKIITAGKGAKPGPNDTVTVNYTGKLINGQVFDSSDKQGHPISFQVNQVIKGWTEVLQLMPVGSTWEVYIPADLAYGQQAVGPMIGPNETLIFSIQLLSIQKK
ncbi:MAG: FKBP-type peptidyl-prolyl cis-trans isomerase FklB [Pseudomonadota bacterium]|nr:FKBP-type peptidyl-prolyl cis-trans isomerase FklB [Pseudomonadota bacterium]